MVDAINNWYPIRYAITIIDTPMDIVLLSNNSFKSILITLNYIIVLIHITHLLYENLVNSQDNLQIYIKLDKQGMIV